MPQRLKPGDELTTGWLNKLLSLARSAKVRLGNNSGLNMVQNEQGTWLSLGPQPPGGQLAYTTSTITARSGTTAGTGTVYLVTDALSGSTVTLTNGTTDTTVYNYSAASGGIAANKYCWIAMSPGGNWFVVSVEC